MTSRFEPNLRTTIVQAFARTVLDDSASSAPLSESGGRASMPPISMVSLPRVGDRVGEHYRLVKLLGQGMFGKVYVAQREDVPEHRVALKLLPRALYAGRNVERELVMLATVGHPHVVQLKDHGTTAEYVWLTMPVYEGETLAERLSRGCLTLREAHDIFLPIARGLSALHAAGLRHQDVKPENIYLADFGGLLHPILLDLGVAVEREAPFVAGTALYGAPEQVAVLSGGVPGIVPISEKMDTYGLGATLLVALVGPSRFPGEEARDRKELHDAHLVRARTPLHRDALPELRGALRARLDAAFARWMAMEQDARPSMGELSKELDILLEPEREAERAVERKAIQQKAALLRFKMAVGALLLAGAGAAAVVYGKRETLRVAGELERVRREGEKSFDKLETCAAAHRVAVGERARMSAERDACAAARDKERAEFKQILDDVERSGSSTEAERARQAQAAAGKLKSCEDAASAAQKACLSDQARLSTEIEQGQAELAAIKQERAQDRAQIEAEKRQIAALEQERDQCRAEKLECSVDRDALKVLARNVLSPVPKAPPQLPGAPGDLKPAEPPPAAPPSVPAVQAPPPPAALPPAQPAAAPPPPAAKVQSTGT
ncbi:MAG: protein kinase [Byssovorax sp.]